MQLKTAENLELLDAKQQTLGQIAVDRIESGVVTGQFFPEPAFSAVEQLFRRYEAAVNVQALNVVDDLDQRISRLRLRVVLPEEHAVAMQDVQIWSDGGISFRQPEHERWFLETQAMQRAAKR